MVSVKNTETIEDLRENERFCLSEDQRAIFDEANRFAEKELYPLAEKMDAEEQVAFSFLCIFLTQHVSCIMSSLKYFSSKFNLNDYQNESDK